MTSKSMEMMSLQYTENFGNKSHKYHRVYMLYSEDRSILWIFYGYYDGKCILGIFIPSCEYYLIDIRHIIVSLG